MNGMSAEKLPRNMQIGTPGWAKLCISLTQPQRGVLNAACNLVEPSGLCSKKDLE